MSNGFIDPGARPCLCRGVRLVHNETHGGWVLLAPERVFKADAVAAEVLRRCTGRATFGEIVGDLAKIYAAPRDRIASDVAMLVSTLLEKRLMELTNDEQR